VTFGFNSSLLLTGPRPDLTPLARAFPIAALPRVLREAALHVSKSKRISTTTTGMTVSGVASFVAMNLARFKMPGKNGGTRTASIYSVIITPWMAEECRAIDPFMSVIQTHDKAAIQLHLLAMKQFKLAHADWKDDRKDLRTLKKKLRRDGGSWQRIQADLEEHDKTEPIEPIEKRLLFSDITSSRFIGQLDGIGRSLGLVSDGADFVLENLPRLCGYLNLGFDGHQIELDRAKGKSLIAYDPRITVLLSVKNDLINRFDGSYGSRMRSTEYWGRNLFGTAFKISDEQYLADVNVSQDALDVFLERTYELIAELERRRHEGITELDEVELDDEATECWNAFAMEMNSGMSCDDHVGHLVDISDFASRAAEHAGRLATVWTVIIGEKKISIETIQGAIDVIRFHLGEFQDRYSLFRAVPNLMLQAHDLDKFLSRIWQAGHRDVPKSFIERNAKSDLRNVTDLDAALKLLKMMSMVQLLPGPGRGLRIVHVPHPGRPFQFRT